MAEAVSVEGLRELNRAFKAADAKLHKDLRGALKDAAEPVRSDAEHLAVLEIENVGVRWSRMRVGVTQREVYVAPVQRGINTRGKERLRRPNLATLLTERSLEPALHQNIERVLHSVDHLLGDVEDTWEHA